MPGCKLTSFAIIFSHCKLVSNLYFFRSGLVIGRQGWMGQPKMFLIVNWARQVHQSRSLIVLFYWHFYFSSSQDGSKRNRFWFNVSTTVQIYKQECAGDKRSGSKSHQVHSRTIEERDRNVVLSPGVTSARQKISDFFHDEKAASIIMNLHYAASYSRYLLWL